MTPGEFRELFPILERKVFLNSCSKGALATKVEEAYAQYLKSWRREGSPWELWGEILEKARAAFSSFFGCSSDELALTFCASTAASGLASALRFDSGERSSILLGDFEFPTMSQIWRAQQKRGARIVRLRAENGCLPSAAYAEGIDEQTLLVPVTHICFRNGHRQDLPAVVEAARKAGALSLVDDYQSSGTRPLDVGELGCDFFISGCLKYLLGSSGLAFLYVRRDRIETLEPTMTGWFGQEDPFAFDIDRASYHASARRFETGTPPVPNLYAALAGLEVLSEVGPEAIARQVEKLAGALLRESRDRGFRSLTPEAPESRGPLVVLGCRNPTAMVEALAQENIVVSARGSGLRVSFHYYNLLEDVERLLEVLDRHSDWMEQAE